MSLLGEGKAAESAAGPTGTVADPGTPSSGTPAPATAPANTAGSPAGESPAPGTAPGATPPAAPGATSPAGATPPPGAAPTIRLTRTLGPPGSITAVEGTGFQPNTAVQLQWLLDPGNPQGRSIAVTEVTTDGNGNFAARYAVVFSHDPTGARTMAANVKGNQVASASFLVVPGTVRPSGDQVLSNRKTQFLQRG